MIPSFKQDLKTELATPLLFMMIPMNCRDSWFFLSNLAKKTSCLRVLLSIPMNLFSEARSNTSVHLCHQGHVSITFSCRTVTPDLNFSLVGCEPPEMKALIVSSKSNITPDSQAISFSMLLFHDYNICYITRVYNFLELYWFFKAIEIF